MIPQEQEAPPKKGIKIWLKRLGVVGFTFFLVKGLLWLFLGKTILNWMGCHH